MFDTMDVLIVVNAITSYDNAFSYDTGDYGPDKCCCNYCGEDTTTMNWEKITHKMDCPYLVGMDMLTGFSGC